MGEQIRASLQRAMQPIFMELVNESHQHNVPEGSESHWNLVIVSDAFDNQRLVKRHRLVYQALDTQLRNGIHALTMQTLTPQEWQDLGREVSNPSPECLGGSKHDK